MEEGPIELIPNEKNEFILKEYGLICVYITDNLKREI